MLTDEEKWEATIKNNSHFDGIFFYAVKTTGIFCKPSCRSKAPKKENVLFFHSAEEAQKMRFRACKRCRSDLLTYNPDRELANQVKIILDSFYTQKDSINGEMKKLGLSQRRLIDIFANIFGVTPNTYVLLLRLAEAKRLLIQTNDTIADIAYRVGFNSLSAFYRIFKSETKTSPSQYRKDNAI